MSSIIIMQSMNQLARNRSYCSSGGSLPPDIDDFCGCVVVLIIIVIIVGVACCIRSIL